MTYAADESRAAEPDQPLLSKRAGGELPRWLWLWLPPVVVLAMVLTRAVDAEAYDRWFNRKEGPIEWATAIVLLPGVWCGWRAFRLRSALPREWLGVWVLLVSLGSIYMCGEEISWGWQFYHWETGDFVHNINRQDEPNVHNINSWFNEKPRLLLELWVVVSLVIALRHRRRGAPAAGDWRHWFWPTWACFPVMLLAIAVRLPDRIHKWIPGFEEGFLQELRLSEPQEFYFAAFLALYLASWYARARARDGGSG